MKAFFNRLLIIVCSLLLVINSLSFIKAESPYTEVKGTIYESNDSKFKYNYDSFDGECSVISTSVGSFRINGNVVDVSSKDGIASYAVNGSDLSFTYSYGDSLLNAKKESWHLIEDTNKKIGDIDLQSKIGKGTLVLLTSKDGTKWIVEKEIPNMFETNPINTEKFYDCSQIQLTNGTYYRILIAYELEIKIGETKVGFVKFDKTDSKKVVEVYEFYVHDISTGKNGDNTTEYRLTNIDDKINTGTKDNGYSGNEIITDSDPHYGWELGAFYISDYTSVVKDPESESLVFLKNVGDEVTLSFTLFQNIDELNGKESLYINKDSDGKDLQYETIKQNFGRGTLIIQFTDYQNIKHEPMVYTNFLEANASTNANTVVSLFEEGDYEVSLDYEIKHDKTKIIGISVFPEINHYKIHFTFKVRNGNCMVYPFDSINGSELTNSSHTLNGFYLDLTKSRYLEITIKKEIMKNSADGLIEDTRFIKPAKDGSSYTDDGIYTIEVTNKYTGAKTYKKIYVGDNPMLTAYMYTGLSIAELKQLIEKGAEIKEDGTIIMPVVQETTDGNNDTPSEIVIENVETKQTSSVIIGSIVAIGVIVVCYVVSVVIKKKNEEKRRIMLEEKKSKAEQELISLNEYVALEDKSHDEKNS